MSPLYTQSSLPDSKFGIRGGARPFQLRGGSIKQNESFETLQELKGRSEKFKN
jgi:hypothetical protein